MIDAETKVCQIRYIPKNVQMIVTLRLKEIGATFDNMQDEMHHVVQQSEKSFENAYSARRNTERSIRTPPATWSIKTPPATR